MLIIHFQERMDWMNIIYAEYNIYHNSIDICTYAGYILRIDCWEAEKNLKTTPGSECALNALAIVLSSTLGAPDLSYIRQIK